MKSWNFIFMLLYCSGAFCVPTEPTSTTTKSVDNGSDSSAEVAVPANMNIADYYYSIFGKHLDYDYREPLLTFDEPDQNALSEEILSEVDKGTEPWDSNNRRKRFIIVPANFFNNTIRWAENMSRLRMERRRLRAERRRQWREYRIRYLQARSEALQRQAARLSQLTHRQQTTRSVSESEQQQQLNAHRIALSNATTVTLSTTTNAAASHSGNVTTANGGSIPVRQVPIPTRK